VRSENPSPWEVVNDYAKTVISVAAGFLALSVTFSSRSEVSWWTYAWLIVCWLFLVLTVAFALWTIAKLTGSLENPYQGTRSFLRAANLSYFALFLAAACFFVHAISAGCEARRPNSATEATKTARAFVARVDSGGTLPISLRSIRRNPLTSQFEIKFTQGRETLMVAVNPKGSNVESFNRWK
jgi:hypothetical protein